MLTAAGVAAAGVAGWALRTGQEDRPQPRTLSALPLPDRLAGVTDPMPPQRHVLMTALDWPGQAAEAVLEHLDAIREVDAVLSPDAGTVTITLGVATEHAAVLWPDRAAAAPLPAFRTDTDGVITAGDVLLQVCAETEAAVRGVTSSALQRVPGATVRWQQHGHRDAPTETGTARTNTGFIDGIVNPRTREALTHGVWTEQRDTYVVVRRTRIDTSFERLPVPEQEVAIGRRRDTGAPLSGGSPNDDVDLFAKTADGELLTPAASHARRAHPANIGRPLMLRRSYSYHDGGRLGLIFVAYLNDPETFVLTQHRLEESDDLIAHTSVDASGCFFVPRDRGARVLSSAAGD